MCIRVFWRSWQFFGPNFTTFENSHPVFNSIKKRSQCAPSCDKYFSWIKTLWRRHVTQLSEEKHFSPVFQTLISKSADIKLHRLTKSFKFFEWSSSKLLMLLWCQYWGYRIQRARTSWVISFSQFLSISLMFLQVSIVFLITHL